MKLKSFLVISSPICLSYLVPQLFEFFDMFKKRYKLIHIATRMGYATIVRKLIENGFDIEAKQKFGHTPLCLAVAYGKTSVGQVLITMGAKIDQRCGELKVSLLHDAVNKQNEELVKCLIDNNADLNAKDIHGETPLFLAVSYEYENIVQVLLENGADPNFSNNKLKTPIFYAKSENTIKILTDHRANIHHKDEHGVTPIIRASVLYKTQYSSINIIKALIKNGADINTQPTVHNTLIHKAVQNCDTELLQFLISNGADTNILNYNHRTPLFLAIEKEFAEGIKLLIDNGTNINFKAGLGNTPLHFAARTNSRSIRMLIKSGADVNSQNNFQETPLHYAATYGNVESIEILIENGANINAKTSSLSIPLHNAALNNQYQALKILLELGAKKDDKDGQNWTAYEISFKSNCFASLKTLMQFTHDPKK